jgi:hypothetical protein
MHTLWIILACFSGVFAFAFLLAGVQGMQEENPEPPKDVSEKISHIVDATIFGSLGSMLRGVAKNCSKQLNERHLIYAGLISLAAFMVFLCLVR